MAKKLSEFSKFVAKKRNKARITYQEIADAVEVSRAYIYDIEKGNSKPPTDYKKLNGWANVLGLKRKSREVFFDCAAEDRDEVPADIKKVILENETIKKVIRRYVRGELPNNIWESILMNIQISDEEGENDEE